MTYYPITHYVPFLAAAYGLVLALLGCLVMHTYWSLKKYQNER